MAVNLQAVKEDLAVLETMILGCAHPKFVLKQMNDLVSLIPVLVAEIERLRKKASRVSHAQA